MQVQSGLWSMARVLETRDLKWDWSNTIDRVNQRTAEDHKASRMLDWRSSYHWPYPGIKNSSDYRY